MRTILDVHTHHSAPQPEAVVCVVPEEFHPLEGQLYSVGIHPWSTTAEIPDSSWEQLEKVAAHPQVVAIGECGIDLVKGGALFRQMQVLKRHVELSEKLRKPLVLHCVHAHDIIIGMKKDLDPTQKWAIHGFRGKPTVAQMCLQAGLWLSFSDKFNAQSLPLVPSEFILAETDESPVSINDVITSLSVIYGHDLTEEIRCNAWRFLGLDQPGHEL